MSLTASVTSLAVGEPTPSLGTPGVDQCAGVLALDMDAVAGKK